MLVKASQILKQVEPYTQSNLGDNLFSLGSLAVTLDASNMRTEQIPAVEDLQETYVGQEAVLLPDIAKVREHVQGILNDPAPGAQAQTHTGATDKNAGVVTQNGSSGASSPNKSTTGNTGGQSASHGTGKTVKVMGEYVNLRAKPGTEFAVIGQVYAGDVLDIVEQVDEWFYVQTSTGMFGYVNASLVKVQ